MLHCHTMDPPRDTTTPPRCRRPAARADTATQPLPRMSGEADTSTDTHAAAAPAQVPFGASEQPFRRDE